MSRNNRARRDKKSIPNYQLHRTATATTFDYPDLLPDLRQRATSVHPYTLTNVVGQPDLIRSRTAVRLQYVRSSPRPQQHTSRWSSWRPRPQVYTQQVFAQPQLSTVCIRRKRRREVLFANRRVGRGSSHLRRPRYNELSRVSCRRT